MKFSEFFVETIFFFKKTLSAIKNFEIKKGGEFLIYTKVNFFKKEVYAKQERESNEHTL